MIIDSLLVALGFDVDKDGIAEFEKRVEEARDTVLSMVAAAGAAAAAVGAFVTTVAGRVDELGDFADRNEVAIEALQELGHAAQMEGSGIEALMSSIEGLNKVTGEAVLGIGRGAKTFETLGFKARDARGKVKSVDQMLEEVSERMKTMSRQEALGMAGKLGIDASLVPLLQKGAERMRELREEARAFGVASEEDAKKAGALSDEIDRMKFLAQSLGVKLATELMPIVTRIFERFKDWYLQNKEIIQQRLQVALAIITTTLGVLWDVVWGTVSAVSDLVSWLSKFKAVTYLATAALAAFIAVKTGQFFQSLTTLILGAARGMMAFNAAALLIPMAVGAIILALGLLIEDFMVFRRGGQSVIGDLLNKWPNAIHLLRGLLIVLGVAFGTLAVKGAVAMAALVVSTVTAAASQVAAWLSVAAATLAATWPILLIVAIIAAVGVAIWALYDNWAEVVDFIEKAATAVGEAIKNAFNGAIDWVIGLFDKAWGKVSEFFDFVSNGAKKIASAVGIDLGTASEGANAMSTGGDPVLEMISQSPAMTGAQPSANYGPTAKAGPLGNTNSMTQVDNSMSNSGNTTIQKIEIVSPDPSKAGEAVKREMDRANKTGIRNGQAGYL